MPVREHLIPDRIHKGKEASLRRDGIDLQVQLGPATPLGSPIHQNRKQTPTMTVSRQRQTAEAVVAAFNNMDVDSIIAHRSPDCLRHFIPKSLGFSPQNNATYGDSLHQLSGIFHNFSCTVNDLLEDKQANRICLYLSARGDTVAGEYVNEYMWLLDFDESGEKITCSKEYSDTVLARDFFPKLKAAMMERRGRSAGQDGTLKE